MGLDDGGIAGDREFPTTSWSLILRARDPSSPDLPRHLGHLVERYWKPICCVIRHGWAKSEEDAKDLTQEFFATVVFDRRLLDAYAPEDVVSFRALLRTAVKRFMIDVGRRTGSQKRGGGAAVLPLQVIRDAAVEPMPGVDELTPEQIFDLAWRHTVIGEALGVVERKLRADGDAVAFEVFRRYDVEEGSADLSYAQLGRELALSADRVKHALERARTAFRDVVTDIVRDYVRDTDELVEELNSLIGA